MKHLLIMYHNAYVFTEKWHGWVLWWAIVWFCIHCQRMGAILWITLCEAPHYLWWCQPPQPHDCLLVQDGTEHDLSPNEGNVDWPCHNPQLVICQERPAQVCYSYILLDSSKYCFALLLIHLNWVIIYIFLVRFETCYQIALAIKKEVEDLEAAGIQVCILY